MNDDHSHARAAAFIIHRLRAKPVEYTVTIRHFVAGGDWVMSVTVNDVADAPEDHARVADDLRRAALMIEEDATRMLVR